MKTGLFEKIIGSFKGAAERGFEFAADLIIPYVGEEKYRPQLGSFLLVQLTSTEEEAALGRITKVTPSGRLATEEGEDYIERMRVSKDEIPKELKQRMIKYRVQIKMLGVLRDNPVRFTPSQRRMPYLGAQVAWPSPRILAELCKLGGGKTSLGHFALGEFIYDGKKSPPEDEFFRLSPELPVTFDINNLVARRTAVFARAGYGKSNLMKYLVSELYRGEPKTDDKHKRPVGMLIFDADGEYFWTDSKGRPGLCDVPHLRDKIAVYTKRRPDNSPQKSSFAGTIKMDIRRLKPSDVFSTALSPERQEQQNVRKLKAVKSGNWERLVDLVHQEGISADENEVGKLLGFKNEAQIKGASVEINAARSNLHFVVKALHDPDSKLLDGVMRRLKQGKIVVADISLLSAKGGEIFAGLLMRQIFSGNQEGFTRGESIPVIAVIEEAQRTLGGRLDETSPFVEWVKEGRKYDLGAVLVTQQPGSISGELLSQVDNWFCFHLLSEGDAGILGRYNSHFSSDILAHMIAEPIKGNCYMWSAPDQPFVLPVRVHEFQVEKGAQESAPAVPVKEQPDTEQQKSMKRLSEQLKAQIRKKYRAIKFESFSGDMRGMKDGQLYFLIKEGCPDVVENDKINALKEPLLNLVFNGGADVRVESKNGEDYYCAPAKKWDEIFGK